MSYRSDKREAADSIGALDRSFDVLRSYLNKYRELACNQSFNLACHSMGNYLLEQLVRSDLYANETIFFDNIALLAPDVNNQGHEEWVDLMAYRKRLYVTINEDDVALAASRAKFGEQQLARLGHWIRNLIGMKPFYIDLTEQVGTSHSYFKDESIEQASIRNLFDRMFNGRRAEQNLVFNRALGVYQISE